MPQTMTPLTRYRQALISLALVLCASLCAASTPVVLAPLPQLQFFTQTGVPLAFGCVFSYQSQTSTQLATYTDFTGNYQNPNPVILSAGGSANIWLQAGQTYTLIVKSSGGLNCSLGTTLYTIDGVGGGQTQQTAIITPSGGSATFIDASQNQLFTLTLTANVTGQPISAVTVIPPGFITFQITQDGIGSRTFSWPANTVGAATVCPTANCVTTQMFEWNGTNATAIGPATYSTPAMAVPNLYDYGLSASGVVCTSSAFLLTSTCGSIYNVTYNGQAVGPGGTGNVNNGAAAHSVALNEGSGAAITGLALGAHQAIIGTAGSDPVAKTIPDCQDATGNHLNYTQSTDTFNCGTTGLSVLSYTRKEMSGDVAVSASTGTTLATQAVTMPSSGCPCRAQVQFSIGIQTASAGGFSAAVTDGTNTFAAGQTYAAGSVGGNAQVGITGAGWSHITYANNAVVTFTLKTESVDTGYTVKQAFGEGIVQNSGMDITIFASN